MVPVSDEVAQAGASALREYDRRAQREQRKTEKKIADDAKWREEVVAAKPIVGRIATAFTPRPTIEPERQSTTAWKVGAEGERRVAEILSDIPGIYVLHDRKVPRSRANIDHIAITPAGVFVIDAKKYKGAIEVREKGTMFKADRRLYVNGRDRTKLVEGVRWQVEVVTEALAPLGTDTPVSGVLCFVGCDWGWRKKPKIVNGVTSVWPVGLAKHLAGTPTDDVDVERIAGELDRRLEPAAR